MILNAIGIRPEYIFDPFYILQVFTELFKRFTIISFGVQIGVHFGTICRYLSRLVLIGHIKIFQMIKGCYNLSELV